ncbi:hypothetical protein R1flu_004065 [Riccia fluitans]|uniref:SKP1 component POZ domain-containing protein n=1 Tax=Riccia fluitans TaxID=41844 RepID=A0ABD1YPR5_9MARC
MDKRYILTSQDGVAFEVGNEIIARCQLLKFVTEDLQKSMEGEKIWTLPVPAIRSEVLRHFIALVGVMESQPEYCDTVLKEADTSLLIALHEAADFLISLEILDIVSDVIKKRTSEEASLDPLCKQIFLISLNILDMVSDVIEKKTSEDARLDLLYKQNLSN